MDITSVKHWANKFNKKRYNMRTNRLSNTNESINPSIYWQVHETCYMCESTCESAKIADACIADKQSTYLDHEQNHQSIMNKQSIAMVVSLD